MIFRNLVPKKRLCRFLSIQINVKCFVLIIYLCFKEYENWVLSRYNYKIGEKFL